MSRDVAADACFLCDKIAVLGGTIKDAVRVNQIDLAVKCLSMLSKYVIITIIIYIFAGPKMLRALRRRSAAARLLRSWVRIPPRAWMSVVSVVCCQVEVSAKS